MKKPVLKTLVGFVQRTIKTSRRLIALLGLALGIASGQAQFVPFGIPLYEPFQYPENEYLGLTGSSGTNWWAGNSTSSSSARSLAAAALSYPGLVADANATPRGLKSNTGTGKIRYAGFTTTTNTIYASFLLNVTNTTGTADRLVFTLNNSTNGNSGASGVWLDAANRLKISKNSSSTAATPTTYALTTNVTYLVVFGYRVTGGNDEVALWLNPTSLGSSTAPSPTITSTNNANVSSFKGMAFYGSANTPLFYLDEIRVSTNWADVTPTNSAVASPVYSVTGGGAGCPGDAFPVGLSGSDSGATYLLLTNGVPTGNAVAGTGSSIGFGTFADTLIYTVLATNATGTNWMSGSASINVLASPAITVQPSSITAAANSTVAYSLSATGSGLNYQWYRNGSGLVDDSHINGAATAVLKITGVTALDQATSANGYYCIITNSCGYSVTSVTNALTLQAADSLVWQGTPTNTWDNAVTANWTNSAGTAVVFNPGDNAILDDTFVNPTLLLGSAYLSPGNISYLSQFPMAFGGSGSIIGTNSSLLINSVGGGTLTISNVNTFAGGTTASNGTVKLTNIRALGTGPVKLAGGTLEVAVGGSTGLSNALNVAVNSTLQYDQVGTEACVLRGTVNGPAGTTLSVYLNSSSTANNGRLRFYANFTNDLDIVFSSLGATIDLAPYNPSGVQIFNGLITGNYGRVVARNDGTVIFTRTNTFNDSSTLNSTGYSLLLASGNVGIGADSVSSTPPVIDASPVGTGIIAIPTGSESGDTTLFAYGGARSIANPVLYTSTSNTVTLGFTGTNALTLAGAIQLALPSDIQGTNRTLDVENTAATTLSGIVSDNGLPSGIIKTGSGSLYLDGANTYTGTTAINGGVLAGIGTIAGPVTVGTNGAVGGGSATTIGTLTVNNNLDIAGNAFIRLNKSLAQSNDLVSVTGALTNSGTGTLTVTNIGVPALVVGDNFKVFSGAVSNGAALTVVGGGMNWANNLAVDGSIQALSVYNPIATYPTNITATVNGGSLQITWPATHLGWMIEAQTNALNVGLSNNWVTISNTATQLGYTNTIDPSQGGVFYRLRQP